MKRSARLTAREQGVEDWFELPMIIVTMLLVVTTAVPLLVPLSPVYVGVFAFLNLAIWCTFYVELFVKFYVAKNKKEALKRNWSLLIIVTVPLFLPLRLMRLSRLFGLVRFLRLQNVVSRMQRSLREFIYNIEYILVTIVFFVLSSGFIMWQVETRFDGSLTSVTDSLWWALTTITTVSYGGIMPTSLEGKVVGIIVSLLGTILFMIFVARVTALFIYNRDISTPKRLK